MNALLVVDLQKQFSNNDQYKACIDYVNTNKGKYDLVIPLVYSQYVMGDRNDMHERNLSADVCRHCSETDLEYDTTGDMVIIRNTRGSDYALHDIPSDCHVDVIGCDDMSGIMANCCAMWDRNIDFKILSDYVYTNDTSVSLNNYMKQHFGKCVA